MRSRQGRATLAATLVGVTVATACSDKGAGDRAAAAAATTSETLLYIWAGPRRAGDSGLNTPPGNDVLLTVDLALRRVVHVLDVGSANNEPHHTMLCGDRLFAGGLLSGRIFVFDVSSPRAPTIAATIDGHAYGFGAPDEFECMSDGSTMGTMMTNAQGRAPGAVIRIAPDLSIKGFHPQSPPAGFDPHDIEVDEAGGRMITPDFIEIASVASDPPAPVVRDTLRIWDLAKMEITETVKVCTGPMEAQFLAGDDEGRMIVSCMIDGSFGVVAHASDGHWHYTQSLDTDGADQLVAQPGIIRQGVVDGERTLWIPLSGYGEVRRYGMNDPTSPVLRGTANVGTGAHFMIFSDDGARGYVSDYVVQRLEKAVGMAPADDKVWRFDTRTMQPEVVVDLGPHGTDPMLANRLPLQPHGMALR